MKKETLKPCPFCGQEHTTITESNTEGIRIRCPKCNITFTRDFMNIAGNWAGNELLKRGILALNNPA